MDRVISLRLKQISVFVIGIFLCSLGFAAPPNILLIYTDDQGYGDVSCLNPDSKFQTPNIDRLAHEGMTFTDAHCSDSVCTPSRYSLLTGRYSWRTRLKNGVLGAETPCLIEDGEATLATVTRDAGYATAMIGKWHLGMEFPGDRNSRDWSEPVTDMPLDKGFDYFFGIPASLNYGILAWFEGRHAAVPPVFYTSKKKNKIAIRDYRIMPPYDAGLTDLELPDEIGIFKGPLEVAEDFVDADCLTRFTDETLEWLENWDETKPFFIYLPYTSPHKPVIPIDQFRGRSDAGAYGDFMIETDWHVGRLLDFLDENNLSNNTMVIFSSDNGPENTWPERQKQFGHDSNGIYRDGKRSIYEGGHRVPFFIRWPAAVEAGAICDLPVGQVDMLATIAEIVSLPDPNTVAEDSTSLLPLLTGNGKTYQRPPLVHHDAQANFAIRKGDWKFIPESTESGQSAELYDLAADPSETTNLIGENTALADSLGKELSAIVGGE